MIQSTGTHGRWCPVVTGTRGRRPGPVWRHGAIIPVVWSASLFCHRADLDAHDHPFPLLAVFAQSFQSDLGGFALRRFLRVANALAPEPAVNVTGDFEARR